MPTTSGSYVAGVNRRIQWTIANLENPANQYGGFRISTSDGKSKSWNDGTAFDYTTDHSCGINVTGYGYATWQGVEYSCGNATVFTENCPDTTAPTLQITYTTYPNHIESSYACINQDGDFSSVTLKVNGTQQYSNYSTQYTYDKTNLASNTTYTFEWTVWDVHNNSRTYTYYISTTAGSPPNSPTNFNYTTVDATNRIYNVTWSGSAGATSYEVDAYVNGTRAIKYQGSSTSAQITLDTAGTTYQIEVYAKNANGTSSALVGNITTTGTAPQPPNTPTNFGYTIVDGTNRVYNITWNGSAGATSYEIDAYRNGTRAIKYQGSSTNANITLDEPGANYQIEVYAMNANGTSGALIGYITTTGTSVPGGTPDTLPGGGGGLGDVGPIQIFDSQPNNPNSLVYYVSYSGLGVDYYRVYARQLGTQQWYLRYNGGFTGSAGPFSFDHANTTYEIKVYACYDNGAPSCGLPSNATFTTKASGDTRGPSVMQTYQSHGQTIDANWSISDITNDDAYDTESGFQSAILYMSGVNTPSPRNAMFTTYSAQSSMNLTVDGTGAAIQPQKDYFFHWEAFDNQNNKTTADVVQVTTTVARPPNFTWTPAIVIGQNFNITATQWTFFTDQINAFRGYVGGLGPYNFSTVGSGFQMLAAHYNEARNAIYGMNGNIPPYRDLGETIYASDLNALATALNAVP